MLEIEPLIVSAPKTISSKFNSGLRTCQSINMPLVYLSLGYTSYSGLHHEDSLIDSVHLIRSGKERAKKLILVVDKFESMYKIVKAAEKYRVVLGRMKCVSTIQYLKI